MSPAQLALIKFGLTMRMVGLSIKELVGALNLSSPTVPEPWPHTHALVDQTKLGLLLCTLEMFMYSRIKPQVSVFNSLEMVTLKSLNATMIHSNNLLWKHQGLDLGVLQLVLGETTIATSLVLSLFLLPNKSPTVIALLIP